VFASSSSVYGDTRPRVHVSEVSPTNPITPYGVSKLAGEKYCRAFCATYGISAVSLRYFNVYGPRQTDNPYSGVIAIFANRAVKGQKATIYGDGKQTRDFINVTDVARANLSALAYREGRGEAFNVGTGKATAINELHHMIAELVGKRHLEPLRKPARLGDIRNSCANASVGQKVLKFKAEVPLRIGLSYLVDSIR
jgi:UDP-glucose 4-epimerase